MAISHSNNLWLGFCCSSRSLGHGEECCGSVVRLWVAASSTHQPLELLLLPRWGEGDKLRLGAKVALSLLTFCYNSPCYRNRRGSDPLGWRAPVFGRVAGLLRRFTGCCAPGVELCWSLSGKGAHCSPQPLRRFLDARPGSYPRIALSLASVLIEPRPGR